MVDLVKLVTELGEVSVLTEAADTLKHYVGGNSDVGLRAIISKRQISLTKAVAGSRLAQPATQSGERR